MTDVWDAEYNCREKGAGMQDQDQPLRPPFPLQTLNHMEK